MSASEVNNNTLSAQVDPSDESGIEEYMTQPEVDNLQIVNEILAIPAGMVEIVDNEGDLYLVAPKEGVDMKYNQYRVILDLKRRVIVGRFFPKAPVIVSDHVEVNDNNVSLRDVDGAIHTHPVEKVEFYVEEMGPQLLLFKYRGKIYKSTTKTLNPSRSRWNNSRTFSELYTILGGPDPESLFDEHEYSPITYSFILVDQKLTTTTKRSIGQGYILYLGSTTMNWANRPKDQWPYSAHLVGTKTVDLRKHMRPQPDLEKPSLVAPLRLSMDQANTVLHYGYAAPNDIEQVDRLYSYDARLGTGESVIVYFKDDEERILMALKVRSEAYRWRELTRQGYASINHLVAANYTGALSDLSKEDERRRWRYRYPGVQIDNLPVTAMNSIEGLIEHIEQHGPIYLWPQNRQISFKQIAQDNLMQKFRRIVVTLMLSVPLHSQLDVLRGYQLFLSNHRDLIAWLIELNNEINLENSDMDARILAILQESRELAIQLTKKNQQRNLSTSQLTERLIQHKVTTTKGFLLHRLFAVMRAAQAENNKITVEIGQENVNFGSGI